MQKQDKTKDTQELQDFSLEVKRNIVDIINDCPTLVRLGDKTYKTKNMRYYSIYRICKLVMDMRAGDAAMDDDNKVLTALCCDLDAMCEVMAVILCNHRFTPDGCEDGDDLMSRNDRLVSTMKAKVMNSTFDAGQWAAIIIGAIKSIDLSAFFLLRKSVNTLTDSLVTRKKKSEEIASQFMEALSLQTPPTS